MSQVVDRAVRMFAFDSKEADPNLPKLLPPPSSLQDPKSHCQPTHMHTIFQVVDRAVRMAFDTKEADQNLPKLLRASGRDAKYLLNDCAGKVELK
jgi:hypothetical protein